MATATVKLKSGKIATLEVPDGTTEQQVVDFVTKANLDSDQSQQPSGTERGLGLGVRSVAEGLSSLPTMVGDMANALYNKGVELDNKYFSGKPELEGLVAGREKIGPVSSAFKEVLTDLGLPTPETTGEKVRSGIQKGASAALGFAGTAAAAKPASAVGKAIAEELAISPGIQTVSGAAAGGGPEAAEALGVGEVGQAVVGIGSALAGAKGATSLTSKATGLKQSAKVLANKYTSAVRKGINKGIRPTVTGKGTESQIRGYERRSEEAVSTIIDNKANLQLADDMGAVIEGKLPENLRQFSQSIEQTKQSIFKEYNQLAEEAGTVGANVSLKPIVSELKKIATKKVLEDNAPEAVTYAQQRIAALSKRGTYTTEEAQEAVKVMNQSLESFYKNPSFETASKAQIDAMVVNLIRKELDSVISKATGSGYQILKSKYGALKALEKEVSHRAVVDARRNQKGLIDFSDILTGDRAVTAIMTMNPAVAGQAVAIKGISSYIKALNDPNKIVKNMFKDADKIRSNPNFIKK